MFILIIIISLLEMLTNTSFVRVPDLSTIVAVIAANPIGRRMVYDFFEEKFDELYLK